MVKALIILFGLLVASMAPAQVAPPRIVSSVDPLTMGTDDFTRLADPALWEGLTVTRIEFRDDRAFWRIYRIDNIRKPKGPLWFVPHDNENAAFQAAIYAVRAYGGQVIAVEDARSTSGPDSRMNGDVAFGKPIDPNRNFRDETPNYAREILAGLGQPPRLIVALHTNEAGYDAASSLCGPPPPAYTGRGEISVLLCNDLYTPRRSVYADWPFDDTDSVAIVSYPGSGGPGDGYCVGALADADMNIMLERVMTSDGSLSNFALFHGLPYVNLETQERGVTPSGLGDARSRLLAMIGIVMDRCAPIEGLSLRPPRAPEPIRPPKRKKWR